MRSCGFALTMSSKRNKTVENRNLASKIERFGVVLLFPCDRCCRLDRVCVKAEGSSRCSNCVRAGNCKCIEMVNSESSWKRLIAAQDKIEADEEKAQQEVAALMARLSRLQKQKKLLRKRAGEFLQTDIKDVEELERLEKAEEEAKAKQAKEQQEAEELLAATFTLQNDDLVLGTNFDPSVFLDHTSVSIPESSRGNSNA